MVDDLFSFVYIHIIILFDNKVDGIRKKFASRKKGKLIKVWQGSEKDAKREKGTESMASSSSSFFLDAGVRVLKGSTVVTNIVKWNILPLFFFFNLIVNVYFYISLYVIREFFF